MEHINEMHDFEKDILDFKAISKTKIENLKKEVETYEDMMNGTINQYMHNLDDSHMLQRDIDIISEIDSFGSDVKNRMLIKLDNIDKNLDQLEDEFYDSIQSNVNNLEEALIEIAFILKPEISQIIEGIRNGFKDDIEQNKIQNKEYYETAKARITAKIDEVLSKCELKKAKWRLLKHNAVMEEFAVEILKDDFQDPVQRIEVLRDLEDYMKQVYEERRAKIAVIENMPSSELSKARIDQYLDHVREISEKANEGYDVYVEKLIELKKKCLAEAREYIEYTKGQIKYYDAKLEDLTHEQIFETVLEPTFTNIETNQTQVLQSVIDFMEERDKIQNNVCINMGNSLVNYGKRMEDYIVDHTQTEKKFEYEKGVLEDENDEKLEQLTKKLDDSKNALWSSIHHPMLDENLAKCFSCVDEIDQNFREFHDKNILVVDKHVPLIEEMFQILENDFANLMELRQLSKREELEARAEKISKWKAKLATDKQIKEENDKAEKELADLIEQNADNKKFKPPKVKQKNDKQIQQEWDALYQENYKKLKISVVQIDDIGTGNARLIDRSIEAFTRSLYQPAPEDMTDQEIEEKKKLEEEKLKQEEAERIKQEEEDLKNKKKKQPAAAAKKGQEEVVMEELLDPEDIKMHTMQYQMPLFEKGSNIFNSEYTFDFQEILDINQEFRNKIFEFLSRKKKECLATAEIEDKEFIQLSLRLLDERIRDYYSMKGKIQTEIYLNRNGDITRHKNSYQIRVKRTLDKTDDQTDRFNFFYQEIFESKQTHTDQMMEYQKSLPLQKALTTLQGVSSRAKDADLKFKELCNSTFEKMARLASEDLENLKIENQREINELALSPSYSKEEVEWYKKQMEEIYEKIESHKVKRQEILDQVKDLCDQRRKEAFDKFKQSYDQAVDELTARDATGNVFGQPKREGQKIVRNEFAICQKAETYLKGQIGSFKGDIADGYIGSLSFRQKMMSFRGCCYFYGKYLDAYKEDTLLEEHIRVTYDEGVFKIVLEDDEDDSDASRKEEELKPL